MKRIYANLLGQWVDITDDGTVEDHQDPTTYFKENLTGKFEYDYINIQYYGRNFRIHPSLIQIVTE